MVCYSFPVGLFHSLLHAGLSRRSLCSSVFQRCCLSPCLRASVVGVCNLTADTQSAIIKIRTNVRSLSSMPLATVETRSAALPVNGRKSKSVLPENRFDRRLADLLAHASRIFCEKGYEGASMRDLSRATGMSLAGLYYYFESKEKLLYLIQKDLFTTVMELLRERLKEVAEPEARVRMFILNHVEYFLAKPKAMKVLSHE